MGEGARAAPTVEDHAEEDEGRHGEMRPEAALEVVEYPEAPCGVGVVVVGVLADGEGGGRVGVHHVGAHLEVLAARRHAPRLDLPLRDPDHGRAAGRKPRLVGRRRRADEAAHAVDEGVLAGAEGTHLRLECSRPLAPHHAVVRLGAASVAGGELSRRYHEIVRVVEPVEL